MAAGETGPEPGGLKARGSENRPQSPWRTGVAWLANRPRAAFPVIFLLSFGVGLAMLPFVPPVALVPHTRWEVEAVAASLAGHGTFADPYALPTGPTAHMPPAYPFFLSLLYRVFGFTPTAGYIAWILRVAVASLVLAMLPWLSRRLGTGAHAGVAGGLAGAIVPKWPSQVEAPAAIALGLLLVASLDRWQRSRTSAVASLAVGLAWGAVFHLAPSLLPVLVGCLLFELWWRRDAGKWTSSMVVTLGVVLACLPWTWRNHVTFGDVFFIRGNFGLELRMGNHDGAVADLDVMDVREGTALRHPRTSLPDARLVREVGEREFMRRARREALDWIRHHPGTFLSLSARRAGCFWFGSPADPVRMIAATLLTLLALLGLRRAWSTLGVPQRAAFVIPLVTYPLVYYLVVYMPRYSEPLNGILLLLAGAAVWQGGAPGSRRRH